MTDHLSDTADVMPAITGVSGCSALDNDARQRALLLHYAGEQVYDIFETLTDTGESDDFDKACEKLTAYFSQKKNIEYEECASSEKKNKKSAKHSTRTTHV